VLPSNVNIEFGYGAENPDRFVAPPLDEAIKGAKRVEYGDGVVTYWRNIVSDDPTASITWLKFYEDKIFMIVTFRKEILPVESE
jgi:hypothetical protein